jgi:phage terminase large subunit
MKVSVDQQVNEIFQPLWQEKARYFILMGGRGAGRSTAASQYALSRLLAPDFFRSALMREVHSDIRHSLWRELNDRIDEQNVRPALYMTDNDMRVTRGLNSINAHGFRASSSTHTAKLKSLASYNTAVIEEADEVSEGEFRTLDDTLRTVKGDIRIVLLLNAPPKSHWIIRNFFDLEESEEASKFYIPHLKEKTNAVYIGGTFRDNIENLASDTVTRYLKYKETNPGYYYQMIEGLVPDTVRGKIYSGWQLIDRVPKEARLIGFGEDYGWFPDPACLVAIYYLDGGYIIDEIAYGTELSNEFLAVQARDESRRVGAKGPVIADSAEPKSIVEQNTYGVEVLPCQKGADSVTYRIKVVATKKISVTKRSTNVWESYENYAWAEDKDGNPKNMPAHLWSHAMDAVGYGIVHFTEPDSDIEASERLDKQFARSASRQNLNSAE